MQEINWFEQGKRGARTTDDVIKITFTLRPKGVRLNSVFARLLQEQGVTKLDFGWLDNVFFIKPTDSAKGFKIGTNKKGVNGQISASAVGIWAEELGVIAKQISGEYNEQTEMYEFRVEANATKESAATQEQGTN